jgi:hypothetical protein
MATRVPVLTAGSERVHFDITRNAAFRQVIASTAPNTGGVVHFKKDPNSPTIDATFVCPAAQSYVSLGVTYYPVVVDLSPAVTLGLQAGAYHHTVLIGDNIVVDGVSLVREGGA